jgi:glyoxalase/bleomycin resistance protein/dioxygenase superfamily protein
MSRSWYVSTTKRSITSRACSVSASSRTARAKKANGGSSSPRRARGKGACSSRAATPEQEAAIGSQTGGRVFLFLHTDDFQHDHAALQARGVVFVETPREEEYGTVAVFEDLYGNRWDLLQLRGKARRG